MHTHKCCSIMSTILVRNSKVQNVRLELLCSSPDSASSLSLVVLREHMVIISLGALLAMVTFVLMPPTMLMALANTGLGCDGLVSQTVLWGLGPSTSTWNETGLG